MAFARQRACRVTLQLCKEQKLLGPLLSLARQKACRVTSSGWTTLAPLPGNTCTAAPLAKAQTRTIHYTARRRHNNTPHRQAQTRTARCRERQRPNSTKHRQEQTGTNRNSTMHGRERGRTAGAKRLPATTAFYLYGGAQPSASNCIPTPLQAQSENPST